MSEAITFTVPGLPVAQPRQRHSIRKGKGGKLISHNYTPSNSPVQTFKAAVRLAAAAAYDGAPLTGPVQIDLEFVFPRTKAQTWKTKPMPRLRHTKKPDRDNLEKAVFDALKGLVWKDDAQVCSGVSEKWIAAGDEQPGVHVRVMELEAEE